MLPRRNSHRLTFKSEKYRYIVTESKTSNIDIVALTVNVQCEEQDGSVLHITGLTTARFPIFESNCYFGRTLKQAVMPKHVARMIERAKQAGWEPRQSGPPTLLQVNNTEIFDAESERGLHKDEEKMSVSKRRFDLCLVARSAFWECSGLPRKRFCDHFG